MKSYTDLEQSKKLSEILLTESADAAYCKRSWVPNSYAIIARHTKELQKAFEEKGIEYIPRWSLAALFDILPNGTDIIKEEADTENERYMCTVGIKDDIIPTFGKNPIDACVEMILKLHELKIL